MGASEEKSAYVSLKTLMGKPQRYGSTASASQSAQPERGRSGWCCSWIASLIACDCCGDSAKEWKKGVDVAIRTVCDDEYTIFIRERQRR